EGSSMGENQRRERVYQMLPEQDAPAQAQGAIPPQVMQLALTSQLGMWGTEHKNQNVPTGFFLVFALVCTALTAGLAGLTIILRQNAGPSDASPWVPLGLAWIPGFFAISGWVNTILDARRQRNLISSIFAFPGGLVLLWKKRGPEAL